MNHERLVHLRVKRKTLAAEVRAIRLEELRAKKHYRRAAEKQSDTKTEFLATRESLYHHRKNVVCKEARIAHLANGYLRGMAYLRMEQTTHNFPILLPVEVLKMVQRFGAPEATRDGIYAWFGDAAKPKAPAA